MSINTEINFDMNETVTLPLDNGDSLTLRTHIDGATQEALVDFVAHNTFDGVDYYPSRKTPLLRAAFIQGFVVDESDVNKLLPTDDENTGLYLVNRVVKVLHIPEAVKECKAISNALAEISLAADMKIQYLMDRANAIAAGGGNNVAVQTMEELGSFLRQGRETMDLFGNAMQEYVKQLPGVTNEQ